MQATPKRRIQITISIVAVVIVLLHLIFPRLNIDAITVTLIIVAVIPWLAPLFKSLELPGGLKVEFQDLEKASNKAIEAGLITEENVERLEAEAPDQNYPFIDLAETNQELALVSLRLEIEKVLKLIAQRYSLDDKKLSISMLIRELSTKSIISNQERAALLDMIGTLNHAAHGVEYDPRTAEWVIKNGPAILESLNNKLEGRRGRFSIGSSDEPEHWIDTSYNQETALHTTYDMQQHISKHADLWMKEVENTYAALLKKLPEIQGRKLEATQKNWEEQMRLEREFIGSIGDLQLRVGTGGLVAISTSFMGKARERALELSEILTLFTDTN